MKQKYTAAVLEIHYVDAQDVLTASPGQGFAINWGATWGNDGFGQD